MAVELGILIAIIGCFVGLAGWLAGRDKKIANDGEWKGTVNTKLDAIQQGIGEIKELKATLAEHSERLSAVEESTKSAHKRIDEWKKTGGDT